MIDAILNDITSSVTSAFQGADLVTLIFFALFAILIGLRCNSFSHIFNHALEALTATAFFYSIYSIAVPDAPANLQGWSNAFAGKWNLLMSFTVQKLLGYYLMMLVSIAIVFLGRQVLTRR